MNQGVVRTLRAPASAEVSVKGSRFIARVKRIGNEAEAKAEVNALWEAHPGARHVCFAYRLGPDGDIYRAYDDGEPGGSAGLPILNRLRSHGLSNCLATVVRYFGGTKLGVPGLIAAYSESVEMALAQVDTIEEVPSTLITISYGHHLIGPMGRWMAQRKIEVESREFGAEVRIKMKVASSDVREIVAELSRKAEVTVIKD